MFKLNPPQKKSDDFKIENISLYDQPLQAKPKLKQQQQQQKKGKQEDDTYSIEINVDDFTYGNDIHMDSETVYYIVKILLNGEQQFRKNISYPQFVNFHLQQQLSIPRMPFMPPNSILGLSNSDLMKRKNGLEAYLQQLASRTDIKRSSLFQNFLSIQKHVTSTLFEPRQINLIKDLPLPILDFDYLSKDRVLFATMGHIPEQNLYQQIDSKIQGFLSNFGISSATKMKKKKEAEEAMKGKIAAFSFSEGKFEPTILWERDLPSIGLCVHFDEKLALLCIGLFNGWVACLHVSVEHGCRNVDDYAMVKRHLSRVNSVALNFSTATLYSISNDKALLLTDVSKTVNFAIEEMNFQFELVKLQTDKINNRMFLCDKGANIFILSMTSPVVILRTLSLKDQLVSQDDYFTCLHLDFKNEFIMVGSNEGQIIILQLYPYKKEDLIAIMSKLEAFRGITSICFDKQRRLLYYNFNSSVEILCSYTKHEQLALIAHLAKITRLLLVENGHVLLSAALDGTLKVWCLTPEYYRDKVQDEELQLLALQDQFAISSPNIVTDKNKKTQEEMKSIMNAFLIDKEQEQANVESNDFMIKRDLYLKQQEDLASNQFTQDLIQAYRHQQEESESNPIYENQQKAINKQKINQINTAQYQQGHSDQQNEWEAGGFSDEEIPNHKKQQLINQKQKPIHSEDSDENDLIGWDK